jgi:hypothetical protein
MEIRKLKDLSADEILDFALALSPMIPLIMKSEFLRMQFFGAFNSEIEAQYKIIQSNANDALLATNAINNEIAEMLTRDAEKLIPKMLKDYRKNVFEALAILCAVTVDEIKKQNGIWLIKALWTVKSDIEVMDFLQSAGSSEQTE